jgi:hypothetical protein
VGASASDTAESPRAGERNALVASTAIVSVAGLAAEVADYTTGISGRVVLLFSLSYEGNVPTWYASSLLLLCSAALAAIARREQAPRPWWALCAIFAYLSLDEAVEIHEYLAYVVVGEGVLHFSWVIPAAVIVAVVGALFVPFLRALPVASRRRFVVAGVIYVGGALGMELPLGYWT